jgi:hypothetical protein
MACAGNPDEEILWLSGMGGPSPRAEQRAENLGGTGGQHQVLSVLLGWICLLLALGRRAGMCAFTESLGE